MSIRPTLISNPAQIISGLNQLPLDRGFEQFNHCVESPLLTYKILEDNATILNENAFPNTQGDHPGNWRLRLGNNLPSSAVLQNSASSTSQNSFRLAGGTWVYEVVWNVRELSAVGGTDYILLAGLVDIAGLDPIDGGVFFEYIFFY